MPELFTDGAAGIIDLLMATKLAPSRGEARRLIEQGGISVDDEKVTALDALCRRRPFEKGYVVIRKGKKTYHKAVLG